MIAVMGASGRVGGKVAGLLLDSGRDVRVFGRSAARLARLRDRGAGLVVGDARNRDELARLFDGAEAALVLLPEDLSDPDFVETRAGIAEALCDVLARTGVPHVVALSSHGTELGIGPMAGLHAYEQCLGTLAAAVLVLRCAWFMDNLLASLPLIRAQGVNGGAIAGDRRFPMLATADAAAEAAERLGRRDFTGHTVKTLLGAGEHSLREATAMIGERLGLPGLPYVEFPPDDVRAALVREGMSGLAASLLVDMMVAIGDGRFTWENARSPSRTPTTLEAFLTAAVAA